MSDANPPAWNRSDLDKLSCQVPGCKTKHHHGPLFLHTKCHPKKPSKVTYLHGGVLEIVCHKCDKLNVRIQLAPHEQEDLDKRVIDCGNPSCKDPPENHTMHLRGCHRSAGLWVIYSAGLLHIACGRCKAHVAQLDVKPTSVEA